VKTTTETEAISESFNSFHAQMKLLDESRQEFVSNVSHELKTPLTSMKVLAESLIGMGDGVPVEMYQEFMTDIVGEVDRETKIVNDLLSLVKMDKTDVVLDITPLNMNELIELIMKRLKPIAEKQQIEMVLESFRPVTVEVDEVKITLAISNLIENGIKYNNPGGFVHVSLNADHMYCYIRIEDSGLGIPEESIDHIFERFYRADKSHSREIGGTGLGLAITKNAIQLHHGEIKVASTLGEGTTFDVRLPLNYIKEGQN
jgi:signal transduction histidine kinase